MRQTKVKTLMTPNPQIISPDSTLKEAAEMMESIDCGILPVGSKNRLEGMITDRDIVIRAVAKGKNPAQERVRDYMTPEVFSCTEDDSLEEAADQMCRYQVSRLVVQDGERNLCGILSFGGILRKDKNADEVKEVVQHAVGKKQAA